MDGDFADWDDLFETFGDDECPVDCDCEGCRDDEISDNEHAEESEDEEEPRDPIQISQTRAMREKLQGQDIESKLLRILDTIRAEGMNLTLFLDAVSWGLDDPACHSNATIRFARTGLFVSEELHGILARWFRPPRTRHKGRRPAGARHTLTKFATHTTFEVLDKDMERLAPRFCSDKNDITPDHLLSFDFKAFSVTMRTESPLLWDLISHLVYSKKQHIRNTHKTPELVCVPFHCAAHSSGNKSTKGHSSRFVTSPVHSFAPP